MRDDWHTVSTSASNVVTHSRQQQSSIMTHRISFVFHRNNSFPIFLCSLLCLKSVGMLLRSSLFSSRSRALLLSAMSTTGEGETKVKDSSRSRSGGQRSRSDVQRLSQSCAPDKLHFVSSTFEQERKVVVPSSLNVKRCAALM